MGTAMDLAAQVPAGLTSTVMGEPITLYPRYLQVVSYLRLIDSCITQLEAQGPSRTSTESKEEEEGLYRLALVMSAIEPPLGRHWRRADAVHVPDVQPETYLYSIFVS